MKKVFFLFFLFLFSAAINAQSNSADWGNSLALENEFSRLVYSDSLGNAFFLTKNKEDDLFVEMQSLHSDKTTFVTKICAAKKNRILSSAFATANGITIIMNEFEKATGQLHCFYNSIDWNGKLVSPELKEFFVVPGNKKNGEGSSHTCLSPDKSKLVITYREPESEMMTLYGFDAFKKTYEKQVFFYKNSKYGLLSADNFLVSNNGDFVFQNEKIKVSKKNGDWESVEDWIFCFRNESQSADSALINPGPGNPSLFTLGYLLDGDEIIAFGTTGGKDKNPGTCFARYSISQKKFVAENSGELTSAMFVTPGALDKNKGKPFLPMRSNVSIMRTSIGFYVIMDAGTYQYSPTPGGGTSVMISMYDCPVISLSKEGNVNWIATILRDHVGAVTTGMLGIGNSSFGIGTSVAIRKDDFSLYGIAALLLNDELIIITNDDVKNIPQPASRKDLTPVRKSSQLSACMLRVSSDGKISKSAVPGKMRWHPSHSYVSKKYIYAFFDSDEKAGGALFK
jgi:hypothetical protein